MRRSGGFHDTTGMRGLIQFAGGAFSPLSLSPVFWVKADAGTSTTTDGTGISQWDDQSGNARHLTQGTGGSQPLYKTAIQNGLPVVRYDGVDDIMTATGLPATLATNTLFMALVRRGGVKDFISYNTAATNNGWRYGANTTTDFAFTLGAVAAYAVGAGDWNIGTFNILTGAVTNNSTIAAKVNTATASVAIGTMAGAPTRLTVGASAGSVSSFGQFDIGEVILYDGVLSAGNQALVQAYLNGRWAAY